LATIEQQSPQEVAKASQDLVAHYQKEFSDIDKEMQYFEKTTLEWQL